MARLFRTTNAHFDAFSEQQRERFEDEMVAYLRKEYAPVVVRRDDKWLRELIRLGVENASGYGVVLERDVARYIELMLALSPDFDVSNKYPWAKESLTARHAKPEKKLDDIYSTILFSQDDSGRPINRTAKAPKPFDRDGARETEKHFRGHRNELDGRPLTTEAEDDDLRNEWMAKYHQTLDELEISPATSRPDAEVGAPAAERPKPPKGDLTITLVDAESGEVIAGASVQITGPVTERIVSDYSGDAYFEDIETGEYEIVAMDFQHRSAQGTATVKRGMTRVSLTCRQVNELSNVR